MNRHRLVLAPLAVTLVLVAGVVLLMHQKFGVTRGVIIVRPATQPGAGLSDMELSDTQNWKVETRHVRDLTNEEFMKMAERSPALRETTWFKSMTQPSNSE